MKRSILLLILFLILTAVVLYTFVIKGDTKNEIPYAQDFAIENVDDIHQVFIVHRDGKQIKLERGPKFWTVNGDFRARESAINLMLQTTREMKVKYIPPEAMLPRIQENLATKGMKITYFDKQGKPMKTFYMGSGDNSGYGTFMVMENSDDPFAVHVPGFVGGLRARFRLTEEEWRDRHIFDLRLRIPQSVVMQYPAQSDKSFELKKVGRKYEITLLESGETITIEKKELAEVYLKSFGKLIAESIESGHPRKDSIIQSNPFCMIDFDQGSDDALHYVVFPDYNEQYLKGLTGELEGSDSILRFFIYSPESGELTLIQNRVFKEVLRTKSYFF